MKIKVLFEDLGLKEYKETWDYQEAVFREIINAKLEKQSKGSGISIPPGRLIFVEHPHVYTLGKSGSENNLLLNQIQLLAKEAVFFKTNRGGDITYHGPGQIVGYPIIDLESAGLSLKNYIFMLEESVILALSRYGLQGSRLAGATGVWISKDGKRPPEKICAIGVRSSRYVTMHGFAFNINTDLDYFKYINPCGFTDKDVTSLQAVLGNKLDFTKAKNNMKESLENIFDIDWINK